MIQAPLIARIKGESVFNCNKESNSRKAERKTMTSFQIRSCQSEALWSFALIFCCILGMAGSQSFVATSYSDDQCQNLNSVPTVVPSGACVYSGFFQSYFSVSQDASNSYEIDYEFGCQPGCSSSGCVYSGTNVPGACISLFGTRSFVSGWFLQYGALEVRAYSDAGCSSPLRRSSPQTVQSGSCSYSTLVNEYFQVSRVGAGSFFYSLFCDSSCSSCADFGRAQLHQCVTLSQGLYAKVTIPDDGGSSSSGLATWELILIVGLSIGGASLLLLIGAYLVDEYRKRRAAYQPVND